MADLPAAVLAVAASIFHDIPLAWDQTAANVRTAVAFRNRCSFLLASGIPIVPEERFPRVVTSVGKWICILICSEMLHWRPFGRSGLQTEYSRS
jgi:hypothetical protein